MPFDDHSPNLAESLVATAPSPATTGTTIVVTTGEGAKFPTPPFRAVVWSATAEQDSSNSEIVDVTAISSDTLTVTRNANLATGDPDKQGSARTIVVGDKIAAVITARTIRVIEDVLDWPSKLGSLTMVGHSYLAGATQADVGTPAGRQESIPSKLQGLLGIAEANTLHLGQAGGRIAGNGIEKTAINFAGWTGVAQFVWPNNSAVINAASDVVLTEPVVAVGGAGIIVHGCNDFIDGLDADPQDDAERIAQNLIAAAHAYRFCISRMRAGVVYATQVVAGTLTFDASIATTGTWNSLAQLTSNSGGGIRYSNDFATPATFSITLPTNFAGGIVAVALIGAANCVTHITEDLDNSETGVDVASRTGFSPLLQFVAKVDNERMLVTAGFGTGAGTYTVTRGVAGTSAATHSNGAVFTVEDDDWGVVWSTDGSETGVITGTTLLAGQGSNGFSTIVVKRFLLTAASAGKKITGTLNGNAAGSNGALVIFDSYWFESPEPPPIVVTNVHDWEYGHKTFSTNAHIAAFNTMIDGVVAEFTDGFVRVADVYTRFWKRNGELTSDVNSSATSIGFTSNDPSFDVNTMVGRMMTFGKQSGERFRVTAVSGSHPSWTLTIVRAQDGTSAVDPAAGDWIGPMTWMYKDQIHLNVQGHSVYAEAIYQELAKMPRPSEYHVAQVVGNWAQYTRDWGPGLIDNSILKTQASVTTTATMTQARQWAVPIWVGRHCILSGIGVAITVDSGATIRYGIYLPDATNTRPGRLLQELGTITGSGIDANDQAAELTGCYQVLRPGWYFLSCVSQGANATAKMATPLGGGGFPMMPDTTAAFSMDANNQGWFKSGITGALADWGSSYTPATGNTPRMYIRTRVLTI